MSKAYPPVGDDWIEPAPRKWFFAQCCDCGLVHAVRFRVRDGWVQFKVRRDNRRTAAVRRYRRRGHGR